MTNELLAGWRSRNGRKHLIVSRLCPQQMSGSSRQTPSDAITLAILYKLLILQFLSFASITSKESLKDGQ
jgi:hypothetical protein